MSIEDAHNADHLIESIRQTVGGIEGPISDEDCREIVADFIDSISPKF